MPSEMTDTKFDMRHMKLKAEEAALLAGELTKPSWESRNEGIHERVSFEDSIWGFDLAGGSYYKTPLRVVNVKKGSRAEKAGIRIGDKLKRINDIDTSTLTIQEAHEIIIESGIHLKIAVTAPEDEEDAYFCYQDPTLENGYDSEEERRKEAERVRKRQIHCKINSNWSLQWPWVSKRRVIWHESNCYMVPSKYEDKHREKFPPIEHGPRKQDDIVLHPVDSKDSQVPTTDSATKDVEVVENGVTNNDNHLPVNTEQQINGKHEVPKLVIGEDEISQSSEMDTSLSEEVSQNSEIVTQNSEIGQQNDDVATDEIDNEAKADMSLSDEVSQNSDTVQQSGEVAMNEIDNEAKADTSISEEVSQNSEIVSQNSETVQQNGDIAIDEPDNEPIAEDDVIEEVLSQDDEQQRNDDDSIIDSLLSNGDVHETENSETMDER